MTGGEAEGNRFEEIRHELRFEGQIINAGTATYRHEDGEEVTHDRIWHRGAVAMLALDDSHVWLVRQPRQAAGLPDSLEIPAGKRDRQGEPLIDLARRELVEEIGKEAQEWRELFDFFPTPGVSDEEVWIYLATGLSDTPGGATPDDGERIEIVPWPLVELDAAIAQTRDAKTLVALLWLARQPFAGSSAS